MSETAILQIATLIALVIAVTTHEAAHGFMAKAFGDPTAQHMGRLTLNPIAHIDPFGTIILPAMMFFSGSPFLFGYAKPVPVNFLNLAPRRLGEVLVAFAGPGINFILAFISALLLHANPQGETFGNDILMMSFRVNIILGAFNLFPLLPLDGGRIIAGILPQPLRYWYGRTEIYGMWILLGLIILPSLVLKPLGISFDPLKSFLYPMVDTISHGILVLSGHL
jgi:Zn-dependent protease